MSYVGVACGDGVFVAVSGSDKKILKSVNGKDWEDMTPVEAIEADNVIYSKDMFIVNNRWKGPYIMKK